MNRSGPYEFEIVPFSKINQNDYMTISIRLAHLKGSDRTFSSLGAEAQWVLLSVHLLSTEKTACSLVSHRLLKSSQQKIQKGQRAQALKTDLVYLVANS
eukprot:1176925-Amphidinium_carterae.1